MMNIQIMLAVLTLFGCSSSKSTSDDGVHIGILQYVEHQSLTAARKGFVDELEKEGYIDGDNIVIDYEHPNNVSTANIKTIIVAMFLFILLTSAFLAPNLAVEIGKLSQY